MIKMTNVSEGTIDSDLFELEAQACPDRLDDSGSSSFFTALYIIDVHMFLLCHLNYEGRD